VSILLKSFLTELTMKYFSQISWRLGACHQNVFCSYW